MRDGDKMGMNELENGSNLTGNTSRLLGDARNIYGKVSPRLKGVISIFLKGDISNIEGSINQFLEGDISYVYGELDFHLIGDLTRKYGDISFKTGCLSKRLEGDLTGIIGDVSFIYGEISLFKGNVSSCYGDMTGMMKVKNVEKKFKYVYDKKSGGCVPVLEAA